VPDQAAGGDNNDKQDHDGQILHLIIAKNQSWLPSAQAEELQNQGQASASRV
jgi:hypothetical protein